MTQKQKLSALNELILACDVIPRSKKPFAAVLFVLPHLPHSLQNRVDICNLDQQHLCGNLPVVFIDLLLIYVILYIPKLSTQLSLLNYFF